MCHYRYRRCNHVQITSLSSKNMQCQNRSPIYEDDYILQSWEHDILYAFTVCFYDHSHLVCHKWSTWNWSIESKTILQKKKCFYLYWRVLHRNVQVLLFYTVKEVVIITLLNILELRFQSWTLSRTYLNVSMHLFCLQTVTSVNKTCFQNRSKIVP